MPKRATLVLCSPGEGILGELDPVEVVPPGWQEVEDVVRAVRERHGIRITVLRLLASRLPRPARPDAQSDVTYLAELHEAAPPPDLRPSTWTDPPHPLRAAYARPGGPASLLDWAFAELVRADLRVTGDPVQIRTWNLSAIWRIPTSDGPAWLKAVPPFFAHEPAILRHLAPGPVPDLIASAPGRCLLRHVPGRFAADGDREARLRLADVVVGLQKASIGRTDDLLRRGLFDRRAPALVDSAERLVPHADPQDRDAVRRLVDSLPARLAELADCGFPDTLVHGDAHLGNALLRDDGSITLLDWGDAGVGHPLFDLGALARWREPEEIAALHERVVALWSDVVPPREVRRAMERVRPLGALLAAIVYAAFVENVEPDERVYHAGDVPAALRMALAAVERAAGSE